MGEIVRIDEWRKAQFEKGALRIFERISADCGVPVVILLETAMRCLPPEDTKKPPPLRGGKVCASG